MISPSREWKIGLHLSGIWNTQTGHLQRDGNCIGGERTAGFPFVI